VVAEHRDGARDGRTSRESIGIDGFAPGGLAALPTPEPGAPALGAAALAGLGAISRRRGGRR
jgi:uncharacterized protein (TIGR03382 family)